MNRPIFQRTKLIRAPMGYFRTRPADVWPFRPPPPTAICQTVGPIPDPKTAFNSSGLELSKYAAKCYLLRH